MKNLRFVTEAWKTSPSLWPTRRAALAMVFAGLVMAHGAEEAEARAMHGGIVASGGGSATNLVAWTITNNLGSTQSNIPIEVPVPLATGVLTSNDCIQVLDSDGTTVLPCQEDNRSSNYAGNDPRAVGKVTVILPTITANQKRQLTVQKLSGTLPTSGTDVTAAEVAATSYDCSVSIDYKDGNTYTASAAAALAAGSWTAKTAAANQGKWRTGGGFATEWIVFCPFSRSGGTIFTTNNLGVWFSITAFKAQRGAVSGGNPIIGICTKYWINCGWVQITPNTAVSHWFDLSVTSGSNTQSWVGSSPAKTATLSGTGSAGQFETITVTVPSGGTTFTQSTVGQVLTDAATGSGLVIGYTDAQTITVKVSTPFSGTSLTSGNWRLWGANHEYASDFPQQELWYGGSPAITTKPDILSHLGVAWTGTAGGPMDYFISTKAMLPFSTPYSSITNSLTNVNASGPNPVGFVNGGTADMALYMPTTGGRGEIAPVPSFQVGGLIKFDSDGWTRIFANGSKLATCQTQFRDQTTGKCGVPFDNGTNYVFNPEFGSNTLPRTNYYYYSTAQLTHWTPQVAHHPNCYYVPWLLTGDFYWVEKMQQLVFWLWSETPDGSAYGTGYDRLFCLADEQRGNGWNFRDIHLAMFTTPDRNPSMLGYTRTNLKDLYDSQFDRAGSGTAGVAPYPGLNICAVANTGSGKHYATSGYRYIGNATATPGGTRSSLWQLGYGITGLFLGKSLGMLSTDGEAFLTWAVEGITGYSVASGTNLKWLAPVYYFDLAEANGGAAVNDWDGIYRASAVNLANSGSGLNRRLITGTGISLSAVSGSAVTFTAPTGYFDAGGTAFYTNGLIRDFSACSLQIVPLSANSRPGFFENRITDRSATTTSSGSDIPVFGNVIRIANRSATNNLYIKLTVGPGTATTSDTLVAPNTTVAFTKGSNDTINAISTGGSAAWYLYGQAGGTEDTVGTSSSSSVLPGNSGTVKCWNNGSKNIYVSLSIGSGTATTSDTLITPGNYAKLTVGNNTNLNRIAAAGAGTPTLVAFGSSGAGYVNGDTITVAPSSMGSFTLQTAPVVTVSDVGSLGDVVDVTISTPGRYTTSSVNASRGDTLTQTATSGAGTNFMYRVAAPDTDDTSPMRFGTGFITNVNTGTHVVTIDTTISMTGPQNEVQYGYPFAQTSLVTNLILAPAPYPGDADGAAGFNATLPTPYSTENEYWTIQYNCAKLADVYGYTNGATARAALAAAYTGGQELKWRMVN